AHHRPPPSPTLFPYTTLFRSGTDQPFEQFGAPWLDARALAAALNAANLPGLRFVPITFTPSASKFAKERCQGVYIQVTNRNAYRSEEHTSELQSRFDLVCRLL